VQIVRRIRSATVRDRPNLLDKNIGAPASFYAYITEKSYTKNVMYFPDKGYAYAPYATCMATGTPLSEL